MVTELMLDNRRLIDRVTKEQITMFVQQLDKTMVTPKSQYNVTLNLLISM